jgi:hypothetical protein
MNRTPIKTRMEDRREALNLSMREVGRRADCSGHMERLERRGSGRLRRRVAAALDMRSPDLQRPA